MAVAADDQVVVQGNSQFFARIANFFRHFDIGWRGRRISARMIVDEYDCRCVELQCPLDYLARIERHVVDRAFLLRFVRDQRVVVVQKQNVELFVHFVRQAGLTIVEKRLPIGDHGPVPAGPNWL